MLVAPNLLEVREIGTLHETIVTKNQIMTDLMVKVTIDHTMTAIATTIIHHHPPPNHKHQVHNTIMNNDSKETVTIAEREVTCPRTAEVLGRRKMTPDHPTTKVVNRTDKFNISPTKKKRPKIVMTTKMI